MNFHEQLKKLWFEVSDVALPIAALRDEYAKGPLMNHRFCQLAEVYSNLNDIEQGLSEFIECKKPILGKKPEYEFLMVARPAIANARILLEIAKDELESNRAGLTHSLQPNSPNASMSPERLAELVSLADQLAEADAAMSLKLKMEEYELNDRSQNAQNP